MNVTTIVEKKGHEFVRDKERACGMACRKEKQTGNNKIMQQSQKMKKLIKINLKNFGKFANNSAHKLSLTRNNPFKNVSC